MDFDDSRSAYVVPLPDHFGAIGVDLRLDARLPDALSDSDPLGLGTLTLGADAGYRFHLDPPGELTIGLYGGGGASLPEDGARRWGELRGGVELRARAFDASLNTVGAAVFAEAAAVFLGSGEPEVNGPGLAWRVGVGLGPGMLFHADPDVFGAFMARVGVEQLLIGQLTVFTLFGGVSASWDLAGL